MATWNIVRDPKSQRYDVYRADKDFSTDHRCTVSPQPLADCLDFLFDPGQLGYLDLIELDGKQFVCVEGPGTKN